MQRSESITNLAAALVKFQCEVNNPKNTAKNPQFNSKYAPLEVVINTVKPVLGKYGLAFIQSTGSEDDKIVIKTMLIHESGEWLESDPLSLPAYQIRKGGEKEFNAQGAGIAVTYGRRYSLSSTLGISSQDEDDANGLTSGGAVNVKLFGAIKTAWIAKGLKPNALDPQVEKLYGCKLSELPEEKATEFLNKLQGNESA